MTAMTVMDPFLSLSRFASAPDSNLDGFCSTLQRIPPSSPEKHDGARWSHPTYPVSNEQLAQKEWDMHFQARKVWNIRY